jgi:hypothetical protein
VGWGVIAGNLAVMGTALFARRSLDEEENAVWTNCLPPG